MTTRRRLLKYSILAGAAATAGATLFPRKANAYYSGPASDHFNGEQFFNPGRSHPQNFGRLLHLYFGRRGPSGQGCCRALFPTVLRCG
jgi:hypothetical protein